jgi:hypothetical protein
MPNAPVISSLNPTSGVWGATVIISGSNFGTMPSVTFNGTVATVKYAKGSVIACYVPTGASTGPVIVTVTGAGSSNGVTFTVTSSSPTISNIYPAEGTVGSTMYINGANFGATQGTSTVKFGTFTATILSWSATSISVTVPAGLTNGNTYQVQVNVPPATSNTIGFLVGAAGPPPSNGGTFAQLNLMLFPLLSQYPGTSNLALYTLDPTNFDDQNVGSYYNWKVEDVIAGRTPTISRVILSYRDLGLATIAVSLFGTNDAGQSVSNSQIVNIGNAVPLNIILTQLIGLELAGQNLQLFISRAPGAGPVSITKVRLEGRVEKTPYA